MLKVPNHNNPDAHITSDAVENWGCGAFNGKEWFQLQWSSSTTHHHITIQELIPIVISIALWGKQWSGKTVQIHCDYAAVVAIINSGDSKDAEAMHLCRCLAFIVAKWNMNIFATHVRGADNTMADALSRNNSEYFLHCYPPANPSLTPISAQLLDLLVIQKPDWRSTHWIRLWNSIFGGI